MKSNVAWVVPGLLAAMAIVWSSACSSSDDTVGEDPGLDAGTDVRDGASPLTDGSTDDAKPIDGGRDSSAGDAGGDAGPIDPYVAACARIDACATATTPKIGMNGCYSLITAAPFETSLHAKERAQLENLRCKLAATTCAAVRACDRNLTDFNTLCQTNQGGDHCSGNVHVVCDDITFAPVAVVDCAATGEVCGGGTALAENPGPAGCGLAPCTYGQVAPTCDGTDLVQCQSNGVTKKIDCKTANDLLFVKPFGAVTIAGTTCAQRQFDDGTTGDFMCMGEGVACSGLSSQRCDGTVLETCAGGKLARRDCATVLPAGQGCVVLEDGPERIHGARGCGPVNPTCHETDNETCDVATGVIGFCGLVGPKALDCKALGYAGCKTTTVDGRVTASCFQ
jgi:hypothetical protein